MQAAISALVDTNVIRWMTQSTRYMVKRTIKFDGHEHNFDVPIVTDRDLPSDWRADEIGLLPELVGHEKHGELVLFRSLELLQEQGQAVQIGRALPKDLLGEVRFRHARAPVERGRFLSLASGEYVRTEWRGWFCRTLLDAYKNGLLERLMDSVALSSFEQESVHEFGRYAQICSAIHEGHHVDAWHHWTAERNRIDYFVTLDRRFINAMTQTARLPLPTRPVLPSELLEAVRIEGVARNLD